MKQIKFIPLMLFVVFLSIFSSYSYADTSSSKPNFIDLPDGSRQIPNLVAQEISSNSAKMMGHHAGNLKLFLLMPLSNQAELNTLLAGLNDPKSPYFKHYLVPGEFASRFGTDTITKKHVEEYLKAQGLSVSEHPNGYTLVVTSASVTQAENLFRTKINDYQSVLPNGQTKTFFSPATGPIVPANIATEVTAVLGLDNSFQMKPGQSAPIIPTGQAATKDIYTAYHLTTIPSDGSGETVGIIDAYSGAKPSDIALFENKYGIPNIGSNLKFIWEGSTQPSSDSGWTTETTLDIETFRFFAPGNSSVLVYQANSSSFFDLFSVLEKAASDDLASVISCSWGGSEYASETYYDSIFSQFTAQTQAQGQSVFFSSGDSNSTEWPSTSPNVTAVGAVNLTTNSNGTYVSETAASWPGSGISSFETIPSWQVPMAAQAAALPGSTVSTTFRNVPDVAVAPGGNVDLKVIINGGQADYYGTSLGCPYVAAFTSRVNEGLHLAGQPNIGFLNPKLYQIAQSSAYTTVFHDITTGKDGIYPAAPGYDNATGLGSFDALQMYNALVPASTYTITINAVNGSVAQSVNGVSSTGPYVPGTVVTLTATAANGYQFSSWSGGTSGTSNPTTVTVEANTTITANFTQIQSYTLTTSAGSNGSISPSGVTTVNSGANQTFTLTPNTGYTAGLTVDGVAVPLTNNTYTLTDITSNHTLAANFALQTETVTASAGTGGTISPSGAVSVNYGASQTFTLTPNTGYNASLTVDGNAVTLTNNAYVLTNVTANHTVTASFTLQTETVTASAGANGTISPSGAVSVNYGTSQTFTVTPNTGYTASMTVDGNAVTLNNNAYTLTDVIANHVVAASFTVIPNTYSLSITANNGTVAVNPVNNGAYAAGAKVTLTATCSSGYAFGSFSGTVASRTNPLVITMTQNTLETMTCNVNQAPIIFTGTYDPVTPNSFPATITLGNTAVMDDGLPNPGTLKTTWSEVSGPATVTFGNPTQTLTTIPGTQMPLSTTATFPAPGIYELRISAYDGQLTSTKEIQIVSNGGIFTAHATNGTITENPLPGPNNSYPLGTVVTLTETPNNGYTFTGWSSNASASPANSPTATITINGNTTVTANFTQLTANAGNNQSLTETMPGTLNLQGVVTGATSSSWSVDASSTGPGAVTFSNASKPVSTASVSLPGSYIFDLTATNGTSSVSSQVTYIVTAGYSVTATATNGSISLSPSMSVYPAGTTVTATFTAANANAEFLSWSGAVTGTNNPTTFVVNSNMNFSALVGVAPQVSTSSNQTVVMPSTGNANVTLSGSVKNLDTTASSITTAWSQVSGPQVAINNATQTLNLAANTSISVPATTSFPSAGTYVFQLSASNGGLTNSATETVTVNATGMYTLTVTTNNPNDGTVTVDPLQTSYAAGTQVTLTAVANTGYELSSWGGSASGSDPSVVITITKNMSVSAKFISDDTAPTANAGSAQTITLPSSATLNGTVSGSGVMPNTLTATWSKYTGPGNVSFSPANLSVVNAANSPVNTTASFSKAGSYVLKLIVSDGQLTSAPSYVTITVNAEPTYLLNITAVNGNVSLSPSEPSIGYPAGTVVTLKANAAEGYQFDSWGGDATSGGTNNPMTYTVSATSNNITANFAVNLAPILNGGVYDNPQTVNSALTLNYKVSTALPCSKVTTTWSKVSGPGTVTFTNSSQTVSTQANTPVALTATATFSKPGLYILQLTGSDPLVATKDVQVEVSASS